MSLTNTKQLLGTMPFYEENERNFLFFMGPEKAAIRPYLETGESVPRQSTLILSDTH